MYYSAPELTIHLYARPGFEVQVVLDGQNAKLIIKGATIRRPIGRIYCAEAKGGLEEP